MKFRDEPEYDIDLEEKGELGQDVIASEIGHSLRLKGYCVLRLGLDEDVLIDASDEAVDLKRGGRLQTLPPQLIDAFLGPEGTNEYCRLDKFEGDEDAEDVAVGPQLTKLNEQASGLASAAISVCRSDGFENCVKSGDYLVRGGDCSDEVVDLTEESCMQWISTLARARLMTITFFGDCNGRLEMTPFDEDSAAVEIVTEPGMMVILRADNLHHKHQSTRGDYAILNWIMAAEQSTTRGWTGGLTKTLVATVPTAQELVDWSKERLSQLVQMEATETLEEEIPREWELMIRHSFFKNNHNPVAVRGEAGHNPSTYSNEVLWEAFNLGADLVTDVPYNRWEHELYYDADPNCYLNSNCFRDYQSVTKTSVKHGQFIEGTDMFDNKFFGVSVMEAKGMDPQQRHVLETSYEALYNAGYTKKTLMGSYVAVFTGCSNPEWNYIDKEAGACSGTGSSQAITSNRTSFLLGIMGPSTSIDCEMSSSAMALMVGGTAVSPNQERRVESGGNSVAAIVGGVFLQMSPFMWPRFNAWMNPAGRSFSFDQNANGYVRGECCCSVALKPYADKVDDQLIISDGPCIGTMVGWRMTNNGRSAGLCAPSGPAEQECIADSIRHANISGRDLDGMECHAAGALLSDGVEVNSCATVLRGMDGGDKETLILGSVRSNVGCQMEACGITTFLKVIHNINFANNAPTLHLKQLNPHIEFGDASVCMNTEAMPYRDSRAFHGVASRGMGGTNVNLVCWYSADSTRVPVVRPKMDRAAFAYWPGGGGILDGDVKATEGYYLFGSWSDWKTPEEMFRQKDGSFTLTITLGASGFEAFQILLDGDVDKTLHPERPDAFSGSRVAGPTARYVLQGYHLNWLIDGRSADPVAPISNGDGTVVPYDQSQAHVSGTSVAHARDRGNPGDEYEVKLLLSGKYRAVTWSKISKK